jgi:tetratricopeptide (TPR) repeat protein
MLVVGISVVALVGLYLLMFYSIIMPYDKVQGYFIPLTPYTKSEYILLSPAHLIDIVNELVLLSPSVIVIFIAAFTFFHKRVEWHKPEVIFFVIQASYFFMMVIAMHAMFGMGRDWDIFVTPGLSFALLAAVLLVDGLADTKETGFAAYAILGGSLVAFLPWIALNASYQASAERFENILQLDEHRLPPVLVGYGYESLRKYYHLIEDEEREFAAIEKLVTLTNSYGECEKLVTFVATSNTHAKSLELVRKTTLNLGEQLDLLRTRWQDGDIPQAELADSIRPMANTYTKFLILSAMSRQFDIGTHSKRLMQLYPTLPYGYEAVGWYWMTKDSLNDAARYFGEAVQRDSLRASPYVGMGDLYYRMGEKVKAMRYYERALRLDPNYWNVIAYANLGNLYVEVAQDTQAARQMYESYLRRDSRSQRARQIRAVLQRL